MNIFLILKVPSNICNNMRTRHLWDIFDWLQSNLHFSNQLQTINDLEHEINGGGVL